MAEPELKPEQFDDAEIAHRLGLASKGKMSLTDLLSENGMELKQLAVGQLNASELNYEEQEAAGLVKKPSFFPLLKEVIADDLERFRDDETGLIDWKQYSIERLVDPVLQSSITWTALKSLTGVMIFAQLNGIINPGSVYGSDFVRENGTLLLLMSALLSWATVQVIMTNNLRSAILGGLSNDSEMDDNESDSIEQ